MHWPVIRTNTWCDAIKSELSERPLSTIINNSFNGSLPTSGEVVGEGPFATTGLEKSLMTQGPTLLLQSFGPGGQLLKATSTRIENIVTRPPNNISYSIDGNGFVL